MTVIVKMDKNVLEEIREAMEIEDSKEVEVVFTNDDDDNKIDDNWLSGERWDDSTIAYWGG
jgi:hypothetical protein